MAGDESTEAAVGGVGFADGGIEFEAAVGLGGFAGFGGGWNLIICNKKWLCFVVGEIGFGSIGWGEGLIVEGFEAVFAGGEELFEGAVVGAGEGGFVAGAVHEPGFVGDEGLGERVADGLVGVVGGDVGHFGVEEAGFHAGAAGEAEVEGGEVFNEAGLVGGAGVPGALEVADGLGEEVVVFSEDGEVARGEGLGGEAVDEGVAGGALFTGRGTGAGGLLGVGAVGPEAGLGDGFFGVHHRFQVGMGVCGVGGRGAGKWLSKWEIWLSGEM